MDAESFGDLQRSLFSDINAVVFQKAQVGMVKDCDPAAW